MYWHDSLKNFIEYASEMILDRDDLRDIRYCSMCAECAQLIRMIPRNVPVEFRPAVISWLMKLYGVTQMASEPQPLRYWEQQDTFGAWE